MALTPGYGQTPVPEEERGALTEHIRILLGEDATKADLYDKIDGITNASDFIEKTEGAQLLFI